MHRFLVRHVVFVLAFVSVFFTAGTVVKNYEVARCFVDNAIAYGKSGDLQTVMHNLEYIKTLLDKPNDENEKHDWDDFK